MSYRVDVKPEVFNWAIGESGRELHDIHQKFDMLGQWLDQEIKPTYRQ